MIATEPPPQTAWLSAEICHFRFIHSSSTATNMASAVSFANADNSTLKRSFIPDTTSHSPSPGKKFEPCCLRPSSHILLQTRSPHQTKPSVKRQARRTLASRAEAFVTHSTSMPVQTSSRQTADVSMPSFMSVFGEDSNTRGRQKHPENNASPARVNLLKRPATSGSIVYNPTTNSNFPAFHHQHRGSTSTSASDSSDSSPTTTVSTMDGSSMTEPSPGPSPHSPASKTSPSSFVPDLRSRNSNLERGRQGSQEGGFFELQRPTTPAKKPRNLKNLAVNTSNPLGLGRAVSTASLPAAANPAPPSTSSAPSSPSFVKPPTPPRRRPSNLALTLQTGGKSTLPNLAIPPTPSLKRPGTLRHFQSSPSLPSCSPSVEPDGDITSPVRPKPAPLGFAEVPMEVEEEEHEPNFDVPQSREEKPAAYPHGPICIYESGVYLYFEPTAEQASHYDVVLNVASEVLNPFRAAPESAPGSGPVSKLNSTLPGPGQTESRVHTSAVTSLPENTDYMSFQDSSPTTPKATPIAEGTMGYQLQDNKPTTSTPEYIHIPWEHNTDIVPDLYGLVKVIDDRVQKGKRVLVHCQCGVSRSASLIVAYGLYKNPGISVQEAYDAVKKRSKWIGPNMNLIMQLQEFRNGLLRVNGQHQGYTLGLPRRLSPNPIGSSFGADRRAAPFDPEAESGPRTPQTAPLPPEFAPDPSPQRASTGNIMPISPGPMSAPSSLPWSPAYRRTWDYTQAPVGSPVETPYVHPKGHVIPIVTIQQDQPAFSSTGAEGYDGQDRGSREDSSESSPPRLVPNFSRQLPLREKERDHDNDSEMTDVAQLSLMSPNYDHFNMAPFKSDQLGSKSRDLPSCGETANKEAMARNENLTLAEPFSPRSDEYHMAPIIHGAIYSDDSMGLTSPRGTKFFLDEPIHERPNDSIISISHQPKDSREGSNDTIKASHMDTEPLVSPRAEEFHMTPFVPQDEPDDDFGLLSPTRFEFPKALLENPDLFSNNNAAEQPPLAQSDQQPRVHAILPPQSESEFKGQPASQFQSFGFLSAVTKPEPKTPPFNATSFQHPSYTPYEPSPRSHQTDMSKAPSAATTLRPKYSAPDMQAQRQLQAMQSELESKLQHQSDRDVPDDMSALMSPRVTEFTRNPFHTALQVSLQPPPDGKQKQEMLGTDLEAQRMSDSSTPRPTGQDPRSPPQTGVSPITRNIWDVL